jgi:hypothetical protein
MTAAAVRRSPRKPPRRTPRAPSPTHERAPGRRWQRTDIDTAAIYARRIAGYQQARERRAQQRA